MSRKNDDDSQERNGAEGLWSMERRRLLQLTGASAAGLGVVGASTGVASAKTGCADGPFEASYESGTIDFGTIQSPQERQKGQNDISAAEPGGTSRGQDKSGQPPYGGWPLLSWPLLVPPGSAADMSF